MVSRAVWKTRPEGLSKPRPKPNLHACWLIFSVLNMNSSALNVQILAHFMVAMEVALLLWTGCQGTQKNHCHENLNICFTGLNGT